MKRMIQIFCALILMGSALYSQENIPPTIAMTNSTYSELPFDPNSYSFLVYKANENDIISAMNHYNLDYTLRTKDPNNHVTANDLATNDILIVGWNTGSSADMAGLNALILEAGITGRVVLSGHDMDYHVVNTPDAGNTIFLQTMYPSGKPPVVCFGLAVTICSGDFRFMAIISEQESYSESRWQAAGLSQEGVLAE